MSEPSSSTVPRKRSKWESDPAAEEAAARQKAQDKKRRKAQALREEQQSQSSKQQVLQSVELQTPSRHALPLLAGCRSVYNYERLNHIEEGSYGVVSRARDKQTGDM